MEIKQLTCLRCNKSWWPRKPENPRVCPKCHSPYWDKERRDNNEEKKSKKGEV